MAFLVNIRTQTSDCPDTLMNKFCGSNDRGQVISSSLSDVTFGTPCINRYLLPTTLHNFFTCWKNYVKRLWLSFFLFFFFPFLSRSIRHVTCGGILHKRSYTCDVRGRALLRSRLRRQCISYLFNILLSNLSS